ncbi:MAG: DUF4393 domain-containing protein [Sphingobacteriia bacterium]|nr:DUF4393 domain-containing protein [Sphingobacteriia bacterium]
MEGKKIDITSSAVEKGIDLAKNFLDKLIIPSVEEAGLLLKEKVTFWKFKNQVKMLNKAKLYCEKHNINPKTISLKLLCPLLDYSALEEDEELQDKWAILLANMVDSEQNIQNHVFPYILSQVSSNEFALLNNVNNDKIKRKAALTQELKIFIETKQENIKQLELQIAELNGQIKEKKESGKNRFDNSIWELEKKKMSLEREVKSFSSKESLLNWRLRQPEEVPTADLKDFELSNLIRLGLVKYIQKPYANSQTLEIPYDTDRESSGYLTVDLDVDIDADEEYILTELGELFVTACTEKK